MVPPVFGESGMGAGLGAPREAEGVEYASSDLAPGLRMFGCSRLSATLSMQGCARRWTEAATPVKRRRGDDSGGDTVVDRFSACRGCPIGAAHAGHDVIDYSALYGLEICPRCRKGVTRMISDRICVGCYNREREQVSGKNARGNVPTRLKPLRSINFRVIIDGAPRLRHAERVVDIAEPMVQTLRKTPGKIAFAFAGAGPVIQQSELFTAPVPPRRANRRAGPRRALGQMAAVQGLLL